MDHISVSLHKSGSSNVGTIYTIYSAGVIELVSDFVVCEEGKPLSPEASRILVSYCIFYLRASWINYLYDCFFIGSCIMLQRLLGNKMATFRLHVICRWSPEDFEVLKEGLELSDIESS